MKKRYAGVLLPITALPSPYGVGTMGAQAKDFVEFLARAHQKVWQVLPLVPTGYGDSPYASSCAIAGSPYLIDIEALIVQGLLTKEEAEEYSCAAAGEEIGRVNYEALFYRRIPLLKLAFSRFDRQVPAFQAFLEEGVFADFAAFMAIKEAHGWRADHYLVLKDFRDCVRVKSELNRDYGSEEFLAKCVRNTANGGKFPPTVPFLTARKKSGICNSKFSKFFAKIAQIAQNAVSKLCIR